jgi:hypothetical protein
MADPTRYPETGDDETGVAPSTSKPGMPRWLKVSVIVVVAVLAVLLVLMLTGVFGQGHGQFGPGQHGA